MSDRTLTIREKLAVLAAVTRFDPRLSIVIVICSGFVAFLEGVGIGLLLPLVEFATGAGDLGTDGDYLIELFERTYARLGIPFTFEYVLAGVIAAMTLRYGGSVVLAWLQASLRARYVASLKAAVFERILAANVGYVEDLGSDHVLNTIVTEIEYAGGVIISIVSIVNKSLLAVVYLAILFYLAPLLTILAGVVLGGVTVLVRYMIEPAYTRGIELASANESIQQVAQSGVQGLREVKLFDARQDIESRFEEALDHHVTSRVTLRRNQALLTNTYKYTNMIVVFGLLYLAMTISGLSVGTIAVFLFAMYRLLPIVSSINDEVYYLEGVLPHIVRTRTLIEQLDRHDETDDETRTVPERFSELAFESVEFAHDDDTVLQDVSAAIERGEFAAFVGPSGAGKSTLLALVARLYEPDSGRITIDGMNISDFSLESWRSRVAMVTQDPYLFDDTLFRNVALGRPDADPTAVRRACELARVDEFLDELPRGYETSLGEDGVRLSGGQKQRVAIARALLIDADVLLLDEATSDLDTSLEEEIFKAIERSSREQIILVVTHRLGTVTSANRIFVVEAGQITERGDHEELRQKGGTYDQLYERGATG